MKKPTPGPKGRKRIVAQGKSHGGPSAKTATGLGLERQNLPSPEGGKEPLLPAVTGYSGLLGGIAELLEAARRTSARAVNALMTSTYWEVGRRIVEFEQGGQRRAEYGTELIKRLSADLARRFGRGFGQRNVECMRQFFLAFPTSSFQARLSQFNIPQTLSAESAGTPSIPQTVSAESPGEISKLPTGESAATICATPSSIFQTVSGKSSLSQFNLRDIARAFPLPWSHYVLLLSGARSPEALEFYQTEALRGGWSVRQLRRQMDSQFYERTALSRKKAALLAQGAKPQPGEALTANEEVKDPLVLEFLGLRDEYSESDLEDALIRHLQHFLLELGNDFAFVARQRRLRIDDEWFRVDLIFFHRRLRCLVVVDLKLGRFSHADAGQMHLYLNYAAEHWAQPGENPPVGIILCAGKGDALVRYATDNLPTKVLVRQYLTVLPDEERLADEIAAARRRLEAPKGTT